MFRKFLCFIGIHNWVVVEKKSNATILKEFNDKNTEKLSNNDVRFYSIFTGQQISQKNKICMFCDKIIDGIEDYNFKLFQIQRKKILMRDKFKITKEKYNKLKNN